jgi:hypothetical protein
MQPTRVYTSFILVKERVMGSIAKKDGPPLCEPVHIPTVYCCGIEPPTRLPGNLFLFLYWEERDGPNGRERVIVDRQIWPISRLAQAIRVTSLALADIPLVAEDDRVMVMN